MANRSETTDVTSSIIERAYARGVARKRTLIARCGGTMSVAEAASRLGLCESTVRSRIVRKKLIAFKEDGRYRVPSMQLTNHNVARHLPEIFAAYAFASEWMFLDWLTSPHPFLSERTPLALIAEGQELDLIRHAASKVGEQGAR